MGLYLCETKGCPGYFCSVDFSRHPHAPHCKLYKPEEPKEKESDASE